ncbi:MAG: hemolysin family protein [Steroidobacteraceae bacterium]
MYWIESGIILGLILLNGFFAGSELAIVSAKKGRLRARAERGERGARQALALMENPTRFLSSVQIGITLVGILTGMYSGAALAEDLAVTLQQANWFGRYAEEVAFAAVVLIVMYASLIVGELVPKRIALAHAETIATHVATPMMWVARIAEPLVWLLQTSTEAVARLLPLTSAPLASVTEDDVRALVATGAQEGVFHRREREMIEGVLRLADRSVESVMVPSGDIVWLDINEPLEELWREARTSGHARFLVCDGELDRLLGVITLADLGEAFRHGRLDPEQHLRAPLHVPSSVSLLRLLDIFRTASVHLAIVTDEYGGIHGLATPADILKAIAGELGDVGSRERAEALRRDDGSWRIDGHLSIHELEQRLERRDLTRGDDYHTIAGFVLWHLGRLPVAGETLRWRDLEIEIVDMDGPKIDKLLVRSRVGNRPVS